MSAQLGLNFNKGTAKAKKSVRLRGAIGHMLATIVKADIPGDFFWVSVVDTVKGSEEWLGKPVRRDGIESFLDLAGFPHGSREVVWKEEQHAAVRACPFGVES